FEHPTLPPQPGAVGLELGRAQGDGRPPLGIDGVVAEDGHRGTNRTYAMKDTSGIVPAIANGVGRRPHTNTARGATSATRAVSVMNATGVRAPPTELRPLRREHERCRPS